MNSDTRQLVEQLADRLGTTVEHLWAVLIRQAHISFYTDLFYYAVTVVIIYFAIRLATVCIRKSKVNRGMDLATEVAWPGSALVLCGVAILLTVIAACSIDDTITKLTNPEYWALEQVTSLLKR